MTRSHRIAITLGEPAGIGPDLMIQIAQQESQVDLVVIADKEMVLERAKQLNLPVSIIDYDPSLSPEIQRAGELKVLNTPCSAKVVAGKLNRDNSSYVLKTLERAAQGCLNDEFDAMVTAPLHKGIINDAGVEFTGHTEFLAELTGAELPVMMLAADSLRVALATTHLPLKDVSSAITRESLTQVLTILNDDMKTKFGISTPKILVCGLNPHAGEGGHLGMEEIETIEPVLNSLREQGINLVGPLPADTLFTPKYLETADAVLAMFHDQGLPVLKYVGFGRAINVTLGLPIIRTSVDHGTALDLAGTGKASTGSMIAAIESAITMINAKIFNKL